MKGDEEGVSALIKPWPCEGLQQYGRLVEVAKFI